jgi:hypothetical protein
LPRIIGVGHTWSAEPAVSSSGARVVFSMVEIVLLVADEGVEQAVRAMKHVMSTVLPEWAAGIPLSVEIGVGQSYGDAK